MNAKISNVQRIMDEKFLFFGRLSQNVRNIKLALSANCICLTLTGFETLSGLNILKMKD